ncbi:hypothetical protein JX266_005799 [Neoarthrinium moseri]|nr:hypothetical protein JX266_005799 [Neoarthrinium moseri]
MPPTRQDNPRYYPPSLDEPHKLSIAVELKFLMRFLPKDGALHGMHSDLPLEVVDFIDTTRDVKSEEKAALWRYAFTGVADTIKSVSAQQAMTSYDIEDCGMQERDCWESQWVVKKSNSAEPAKHYPHCEEFLWVPVEVNSPKMAWTDPNTFAIMRSVMDAIQSRYNIVSNYTCEVHVHVGRMDGLPFSLVTLKKLAMLLWLAEPVLRKVKDPASPNFGHVYTWSSAAREHSRLAARLKDGKLSRHPCRPCDLGGFDRVLRRHLMKPTAKVSATHEALKLIASTQTHVQLGRLMSGDGRPYRRLGFNFSAFGGEDERARTNPRTVECRFLEGTIDQHIVLGWMQIFGKLVETASWNPSNEARFTQLVLGLLREQNRLPQDDAFARLMKQLGITFEIYYPVLAMISEFSRHKPKASSLKAKRVRRARVYP